MDSWGLWTIDAVADSGAFVQIGGDFSQPGLRMSNEPMLKRLTAQSPAAEPRSDAEKMQAALQRMKAATPQPDAVEQLRGELDEMKDVIANVRTALLTDSDPSALLDDLENRTERLMAAVIGGVASLPAETPAAAFAEAPAATSPAEEPAAALPASGPALPFDEQAFLDAMGDEPAIETAAETEPAPQAKQRRRPNPTACRPCRACSRSLVLPTIRTLKRRLAKRPPSRCWELMVEELGRIDADATGAWNPTQPRRSPKRFRCWYRAG